MRVHRTLRLLLVAFVFCAAFPGGVAGHATAASVSQCATPCGDGSGPASDPAPHDERDCSLCKAGVATAPLGQAAGPAVEVSLTALPGETDIASPRALHGGPEAARAPPHALFA